MQTAANSVRVPASYAQLMDALHVSHPSTQRLMPTTPASFATSLTAPIAQLMANRAQHAKADTILLQTVQVASRFAQLIVTHVM